MMAKYTAVSNAYECFTGMLALNCLEFFCDK